MPRYTADSGFLKGTIEAYVKNKGLDSRPGVESLVNSVADSAPKNLDARNLKTWCDDKVSPIIEKNPDFKAQAEQIRFLVRREVLFRIYEPIFRQIADWASKVKEKRIGPSMILENFPGIWDRFVKNFRTQDGLEIDWEFITKKIGRENNFEYQEQVRRSEQEAVSELLELLELRKPKKFSPYWISLLNYNLYQHFSNYRRAGSSRIDWPRIIKQLPLDWQQRWEYKNDPEKYNLKNVAKELVDKLEELKISSLSPGWIYKNLNWVYVYFQKHARDGDVIDWQLLLNELPEKWKKCWVYQQQKKK